MLVASNVTIQFGAKPLFENVSVKFGEGNRYGLIGANGSGKTSLLEAQGYYLQVRAGPPCTCTIDLHVSLSAYLSVFLFMCI